MKGFGLKCHISKAYRVQSTAFFRTYDVYRDKLYVFFSAHGARAEKSHVAKIFCTSISGGCPTLECKNYVICYSFRSPYLRIHYHLTSLNNSNRHHFTLPYDEDGNLIQTKQIFYFKFTIGEETHLVRLDVRSIHERAQLRSSIDGLLARCSDKQMPQL